MEVTTKIVGDKEVQRKIEILAKKNDGALKTVIQKAVIIVEGRAKDECPWITGRLRSSITHTVESKGKKHIGKVGTDVFYAPPVEFRHPYLFPALKDSRDDIIKLLTKAIKGIKV